MIHSSSSEKPDVMSFTWNPRLVKTPTPTMSATTIAVAVIVVTVGRIALLAFAVMTRPTPCPHAVLPVLQGGGHCFSTDFAAFPRPKSGPLMGARAGGAECAVGASAGMPAEPARLAGRRIRRGAWAPGFTNLA